jgi:branched-chain amino acid transport system ATP-binding protein
MKNVSEAIEVMVQAGKTILLVEQNVRFGLRISKHGIVMESGRVLLTGTGRELLDNPEMADLFFGGHTAEGDGRRVAAPAGPGGS